ncbi:hypothetical protein ACTHGU_01300 [Chitinophagaceae bacterium MMS25-I14]
MKKLSGLIAGAALILTAAATDSNAQIYVRVRPPRPAVIVTRPAAPSPRHVWVDEDWTPQGRTYVWHGGYWAEPPHPGWRWRPGHWARRGRDSYWIAGHWTRR